MYLDEKRKEAEGYYVLGEMFYRGELIPRNYEEAFTWYLKAKELGHRDAIFKAGIMILEGIVQEVKIETAYYFFLEGKDLGCRSCVYMLSRMKELGIGTIKDEEEARSLEKLAADMGHTDAAFSYVCSLAKDLELQKEISSPKKEKDLQEILKYGYLCLELVKNEFNKGVFVVNVIVDITTQIIKETEKEIELHEILNKKQQETD